MIGIHVSYGVGVLRIPLIILVFVKEYWLIETGNVTVSFMVLSDGDIELY